MTDLNALLESVRKALVRAASQRTDAPNHFISMVGMTVAAHHAIADLDALSAGIRQQAAEKREALEVLNSWDAVEALVDHKPQDLGRSKADVVADTLRQQAERIAELEAMHDSSCICDDCMGESGI